MGRVPALEVENVIVTALRSHRGAKAPNIENKDIADIVERVIVTQDQLTVGLASETVDARADEITIPWSIRKTSSRARLEGDVDTKTTQDPGLIQSIVRAKAWVQSLKAGTYDSVEALAKANKLHPKVVRQALRLAFLAPNLTSAILDGSQPTMLSLAQIPKSLPLNWPSHRGV